MSCEKCKKSMCICPFSFGLALGVTAALAMLSWAAWIMYYGMPTNTMVTVDPTFTMTWGIAGTQALYCFIKGFIFGVVLITLYNFIAYCCRKMCGNKYASCSCEKATCPCGNKNCNCKNKF